jgi:ATP-dependent Clp protease ATP-binding subunit ClpC
VVQSGGAAVSALHLAESLFETGHVSLDNIKRPSARPSSKGAMWEVVHDGKSRGGRRFSDWFGRNLTRLSSEGGLVPFEGREDELRKMLRILSRTSKRHIAVIGKAGVGKTSLVEGLAAMLVRGKSTGRLSDCEVLELHGSDIASDCSSEAELSRRISHLFRVLSRHKAAIFSLDELQGLFPGHLKPDAAHALLTSILADDTTPCVVTCLCDTWTVLSRNAPSLARLFHVIELDDPPAADCRRIAESWAKRIGEAQRVSFTPDAMESILKAARRLSIERGMPDRIVDLIENAATWVKIAGLCKGSTQKAVTAVDIRALVEEHCGTGSPPAAGSPRQGSRS